MNNTWLPMETAPKDGTEVLIYKEYATVPIVHLAWYRSKQEWEKSGQYCGEWDNLEDWEGWWTYPEHSITQIKLEGPGAPLGWFPLPQYQK